jgi:hexosaminidase
MPILLPTPREMRMTGASAQRPAWFDAAVDGLWQQSCGQTTRNLDIARIAVASGGEAMPSGGYHVTITRGNDGLAQIGVRFRDREGLRSAAATLVQLRHAYPAPQDLPGLDIVDAPVFATRGVMLDVSRDKVPTMEQLRETIDLLASLKFNHLQLYTEHTFAYAGHEEVWKDWSPITRREVRELDGYAAARGIELAANQNCFGHLAAWLKKPAYQHLAEIEGNNAWYFHQWERRGPFSLCPVEPKAEAFVGELLDELLPCFTSKLVNIGCDETFDVGWGRSRDEVEKRARSDGEGGCEAALSRARAELYFEFVQKIAKACEKHGKQPMMWADIALTHPEMLHLMPRDEGGMIGLAWWYEPTEKFARWVSAIKDAGHEAWVCPGTSSWRTFTGRTAERRANIADAAEQGANAGATGFLVCDWGDMGHRQQWPIALAGVAQAAEAAWNPGAARGFDPRATGQHVLGESAETGVWLEELGDCDLPIRMSAKVLNASALFNDLHPPVPGQLKAITHEIDATVEQWQAVRERVMELRRSRPAIRNDRLREELDHAIQCAIYAADHAIAARDAAVLSGTREALIARAEAIRAEHERLWLRRNRPGGMEHASSFYSKVIHALRSPGAS